MYLLSLSKIFTKKVFIYMAIILGGAMELITILTDSPYFPIKLLGFITVMVTIDFITGLAAAISKKEGITSKRGSQSFWKLMSYAMFLFALVYIDNMEIVQETSWMGLLINYIKLTILSLAFLWEFYSVGENLEAIYGSKPRIFSFLDSVAKAFEKFLLRKVEEGGNGGGGGYYPHEQDETNEPTIPDNQR